MRGGDGTVGVAVQLCRSGGAGRRDHPLRTIRMVVNEALAKLSGEFAALYARMGSNRRSRPRSFCGRRGDASGGDRAGRPAHGPARVRILAPRAGRASSRSCCTRAASARCGACSRRSGHHVLSLHRSAYAGLRLGTLAPGASRPLRPAELELLRTRRAGRLTWRRRGSTAISRSPAWHAPQRRRARARRPRGGRRRRRRGARRWPSSRARASRSTASPSTTRRAGGRARRARRRRGAARWPTRASCTSLAHRPTGAWRRC